MHVSHSTLTCTPADTQNRWATESQVLLLPARALLVMCRSRTRTGLCSQFAVRRATSRSSSTWSGGPVASSPLRIGRSCAPLEKCAAGVCAGRRARLRRVAGRGAADHRRAEGRRRRERREQASATCAGPTQPPERNARAPPAHAPCTDCEHTQNDTVFSIRYLLFFSTAHTASLPAADLFGLFRSSPPLSTGSDRRARRASGGRFHPPAPSSRARPGQTLVYDKGVGTHCLALRL